METRPIYQTNADILNEENVANKLARQFNNNVYKIGGPLGEIDRCMVDTNKDVQCVLEIKCRKIKYKQYPTVFISAHKIMAGMSYVKHLSIPFWIAFSFIDGIYIYNITNPEDYAYKWDGRTVQTRDSKDVEIMAHIPMESALMKIE